MNDDDLNAVIKGRTYSAEQVHQSLDTPVPTGPSAPAKRMSKWLSEILPVLGALLVRLGFGQRAR